MKKFYVFFLFLLSACATNEVLYTDANGQTVYKAQCDQASNIDMGDCIKLMGQQCPLGFNILMATENPIGFMSGNQTYGTMNTNTYANVNAYGFGNNAWANGYANSQTNVNLNSWGGGWTRYNRFVIYTCKNPEDVKANSL